MRFLFVHLFRSLRSGVALWIFAVLGWCLAAPSAAAEEQAIRLGVYYFPGWKAGDPLVKKEPWSPIKPYAPDRQPEIGWYSEGADDVTNVQLGQMRGAGIGFVAYDWYWRAGSGVALNHALDSYMRVAGPRDPAFALLWANHTGAPSSAEDWSAMTEVIVDTYLCDLRALRLADGRPVFIVFSPQNFRRDLGVLGLSPRDALADLRDRARRKGCGVPFVLAHSYAIRHELNKITNEDGYDGLTAYNYHKGYSGVFFEKRASWSYSELDDGYRENWDWLLANSTLPYAIPLSAGWDKRAWGGSSDPRHDDSVPTLPEFYAHLRAGLDRARSHPQALPLLFLCCWNEYGEGSFVEPTVGRGSSFLDAIRDVLN